jgi:hypothetical protein
MNILGGLEKMEIMAFEDENFTKRYGKPFSVDINPSKYSHKYQIRYSDTQAQGSSGKSPAFNKVANETVSFQLVFDGTGVVPSPMPMVKGLLNEGISARIEVFKKLVSKYNGKTHSPHFIQLSWGKLLFRCRLQQMDLTYTLFKPDGAPLRAKVTVSFVGFTSEEKLKKEEKKSSPDLSHVITVITGDTLPLMCKGVYGHSDYYLQVARVNRLTNFRSLKIGSQLIFPPLAGSV